MRLYFNNESFKESKFNIKYLIGYSLKPYPNFDVIDLEFYGNNLQIVSRNDCPFYHDYIIDTNQNQILKNSDSLFYYEYNSLSKCVNLKLFNNLNKNNTNNLEIFFELLSSQYINEEKKYFYIDDLLKNKTLKIDTSIISKLRKLNNNKGKNIEYVWFEKFGLYEFSFDFNKNLIVNINDKYMYDIGIEKK